MLYVKSIKKLYLMDDLLECGRYGCGFKNMFQLIKSLGCPYLFQAEVEGIEAQGPVSSRFASKLICNAFTAGGELVDDCIWDGNKVSS